MVAFDIDNGNVIWETPSLNEGMQYVSPLLIEQNGKKVIVTATPTWLIGIDAKNGSPIWKFDIGSVNENERGNRNYIHTPIYRDGYVFLGNGYGQVSAKIKVNTDGSEPELMWSNPEFNPHVGGMLLIGNYLYGSTHDNNNMGRYICVDWTTGETMWLTEWNNKGSMIAAEGLIYILEERSGNVALVQPNPEKLEVISSFKMSSKGEGPYWMHPVIDKGRLFLRHGDYLAAFDIKQ
jgi:outer membrane protein assembly factor BamB